MKKEQKKHLMIPPASSGLQGWMWVLGIGIGPIIVGIGVIIGGGVGVCVGVLVINVLAIGIGVLCPPCHQLLAPVTHPMSSGLQGWGGCWVVCCLSPS